MKSVLISIQPKWVEKIASGKKTIEVRKSKPSLATPFKCYIYCTCGQLLYADYPNGAESKVIKLGDYKVSGKDKIGNMLNSKVIGEFVCKKIDEWKYLPDCYVEEENEKIYYITSSDGHATCLTYDEIEEYGKGKTLYGWHISDLKIYDKPKSLEMFPVGKIARDCGYGNYNIYDKILTRPPQSYCYVEV